MDNDYPLDLDEILQTIRSADVITIRFVTVNRRLLFDSRHTEIDAPLVKLVAPAATVEERFRSLKRLRPRFRLPDKITAIWWPKYISTLVGSGVWDCLMARVAESGFARAVEESEEVLRDLLQMERDEVRRAILGEGYQTIWQKSPQVPPSL